jgi:hypothetical protein
LLRASSSRDSSRGLPPGIAAMECLKRGRVTQKMMGFDMFGW